MLLEVDQTTFLGPGRVVETQDAQVLLELPGRRIWARVALAVPYVPVADDLVLAIGRDDAYYVIGVLEGNGATTLVVPADLKIHAPRGRVEISAGRGVSISAPTVRLTSLRLELVARRAFERFTEATRWVRGAFQLRAGRTRITVDDDYRVSARRIVARAEADVKIDGSKIDLG